MNLFERIVVPVWFGAMGLALFGFVYCVCGFVVAESARAECRSLGYPDGSTDGWKAWSKVCIGDLKAPPPAEKRTPISDARQR